MITDIQRLSGRVKIWTQAKPDSMTLRSRHKSVSAVIWAWENGGLSWWSSSGVGEKWKDQKGFSRCNSSDLVNSSDWLWRKRATPRFSGLRDLLDGGTIGGLGKTRVGRGTCFGEVEMTSFWIGYVEGVWKMEIPGRPLSLKYLRVIRFDAQVVYLSESYFL